jgi:hypothetical protein
LGRQLEKSQASSGSRIFAETDSMAASTALLRKRREEGAGRLDANLFCANALFGMKAEEATRADTPLTNLRREIREGSIIDCSPERNCQSKLMIEVAFGSGAAEPWLWCRGSGDTSS